MNLETVESEIFIYRRYPDVVRQIIEQNRSVLKEEDRRGNTLVSFMLINGILFGCAIQSALDNGADILRRINKRTPRSIAGDLIASKNHECIQVITNYFIKHPSKVDYAGNTLLHMLASAGETDFLELAIRNSENINPTNSTGETPLHRATDKGHAKTIDFLLRQGAEVNSIDLQGDTPLHYATTLLDLKEKVKIMRLLLEHGSNPNSKNDIGRTPLMYLADAKEANKLPYEVLLEAGADANIGDIHGITPLQLICYNNVPKTIDFLIANGAKVNQKNRKGFLPLHFSIVGNNQNLTEELLDNGSSFGSFHLSLISNGTNQKTVYTLLTYILLKKSQNPSWKPKNVEDYLNKFMKIENFKFHTEIVNGEIEKLKRKKTMWKLAVSDVKEIATYLKCEEVKEKFWRCRDFLLFPVFGQSIVKKFLQAAKRRHLLDESLKIMDVLLSPHVPSLCQEMILNNLGEQSLYKFIESYQPENRNLRNYKYRK